MPETIVLDPSEVSTARTQLDISPYVRAEGADWGDAEITAFMAEQARGSTAIDFRIPNRNITLPLVLRTRGSTSYNTIRSNIQKKVARIQQEGGWLKRQTSAGTLFADVVNASLSLGGAWMQSRTNDPVDIEAELHLECIPDWYGNEILLPDRAPGFIWTETNILGDYPGRVRLIVDNDGTVSQMGLLWGVRSRHYSNATTAGLQLVGNNCTPLDAATIQGGSIRHQSISTSWTPVLSTNQTGGVSLTHTGTYRVWCRMNALPPNSVPAATQTSVRLLWDVGDFALPQENNPVQIQSDGSTRTVDLGEVRLDRTPTGSHRWQGIVQARGETGGEVFTITEIFFQPVDEGCGVLRSPVSLDPGLSTFSARDEFNQTAGALTGKSLPVGGVWQGAGDTDDFVMDATGHTALRQGSADNSALGGARYAIAGTTSYGATVVQVDFKTVAFTNPTRQVIMGVFARYTATNTHLLSVLNSVPGSQIVTVQCFNAGALVFSKQVLATAQANQWYTIRLAVDATGQYLMWYYPRGGSPGQPIVTGSHTVLATGGAMATGRNGFLDWLPTDLTGTGGAVATARNYDNFLSWTPQQDAVLFPGQSAEIRTEGMFREDPTGTAYGPVTYVSGDLPRIPPSGPEGRTCQWIVKTSRGDLDTLPDQTNDSISARLAYRPSYLLTN